MLVFRQSLSVRVSGPLIAVILIVVAFHVPQPTVLAALMTLGRASDELADVSWHVSPSEILPGQYVWLAADHSTLVPPRSPVYWQVSLADDAHELRVEVTSPVHNLTIGANLADSWSFMWSQNITGSFYVLAWNLYDSSSPTRNPVAYSLTPQRAASITVRPFPTITNQHVFYRNITREWILSGEAVAHGFIADANHFGGMSLLGWYPDWMFWNTSAPAIVYPEVNGYLLMLLSNDLERSYNATLMSRLETLASNERYIVNDGSHDARDRGSIPNRYHLNGSIADPTVYVFVVGINAAGLARFIAFQHSKGLSCDNCLAVLMNLWNFMSRAQNSTTGRVYQTYNSTSHTFAPGPDHYVIKAFTETLYWVAQIDPQNRSIYSSRADKALGYYYSHHKDYLSVRPHYANYYAEGIYSAWQLTGNFSSRDFYLYKMRQIASRVSPIPNFEWNFFSPWDNYTYDRPSHAQFPH